MTIQIKQIKGDIVELVFDPYNIDLRVGENLTLREKGNDRGLIVQVIEFRTLTYPSLLTEMIEMMNEGAITTRDLADLPPEDELPEMSKLKLAIAKIRKVVTWAEPTAKAEMSALATAL